MKILLNNREENKPFELGFRYFEFLLRGTDEEGFSENINIIHRRSKELIRI
jgi:hypothetical protein